MTRRTVVGDQGRERVRKMATRRWGVTAPEVSEALEINVRTAGRYLKRLVAEGLLVRTGERRRRTEIFEKVHGAGGFVYRTKRRGGPPKYAEWRGLSRRATRKRRK